MPPPTDVMEGVPLPGDTDVDDDSAFCPVGRRTRQPSSPDIAVSPPASPGKSSFSISTSTASTYARAFPALGPQRSPLNSASRTEYGDAGSRSRGSSFGSPADGSNQSPLFSKSSPALLSGARRSVSSPKTSRLLSNRFDISTSKLPPSSAIVGSPPIDGGGGGGGTLSNSSSSSSLLRNPFSPLCNSPVPQMLQDSPLTMSMLFSPTRTALTAESSPIDRLSAFGDGLFSPVWQAQPSPRIHDAATLSNPSSAMGSRRSSETSTMTRTLAYLGLQNQHQQSNLLQQQDSSELVEGSRPVLAADVLPPSLLLSCQAYDSTVSNSREEMESTATAPVLTPSSGDSMPQQVSRTLWVGNVDLSLQESDLMNIFARFGPIESIRLLPDKECAFINYVSHTSSMEAKRQMQGAHVGSCIVKVGFGKTETMIIGGGGSSEVAPTNSSRSLWVGNLSSNVTAGQLYALFQTFGSVESCRLLPHKNCGFVNFYRLDDAVKAKSDVSGRQFMGSVLRVGFARAPSNSDAQLNSLADKVHVPAIGVKPTTNSSQPVYELDLDLDADLRVNDVYAFRRTIQPLESKYLADALCQTSRHNDLLRLREARRQIEMGLSFTSEIDDTLAHFMPQLINWSTDSFGNTVIQKLIEKCSESMRTRVISMFVGKLAAVGVHKNGTWVVQKIVECAQEPAQIQMILRDLIPYTLALMQDPYGNYVIQGCLRLGEAHNDFVFDAMCLRCLELGQVKFGARAMRACLESPSATQSQQQRVAMAVLRHSTFLAGNQNGIVLLHWFIDNLDMPGRYTVLAKKFLLRLPVLISQKLSHVIILKLLNQTDEPEARRVLCDEGVFRNENTLLSVLFGGDASSGVVSECAVVVIIKCLQVRDAPLRPALSAALGTALRAYCERVASEKINGRFHFLLRLLEE